MIRYIKSHSWLLGWVVFWLLRAEIVVAQPTAPDASGYPRLTVSVQAGLSAANSTCIPCSGEGALSGYSAFTSVGIELNERFILEAAAGSWVRFGGHKNPRDSRLHLFVKSHYRPFPQDQLAVIAGFGMANFFYTPETAMLLPDGSKSLGSVIGYGPAFMTGTEYHFVINRKIVLSPFLEVLCSFPGDLLANDEITIPNRNSSLIFTVGVNFRWMAIQQ
jgi:hypothetical protein